MIYCLTSKEFIKSIELEDPEIDDLICSSFIILASGDIVTRGVSERVANYKNVFYPGPDVFMSSTESEMIANYQKQLDSQKFVIAILIYNVIKDNENIIIIASNRETKIFNYLFHLMLYILDKYDYYSYYKLWRTDDILNTEQNRRTAYKKSKRLIEKTQNVKYKNTLLYPESKSTLIEAIDEISDLPKKRVSKILKLIGEDPSLFSNKKEMITFLREELW